MPPALITPMLIGAAVGAVSAAIQGGNILKGALMGAVTAGIGNMVMPAISAAVGGVGSEAASAASAIADEAVASGGAAAASEGAASAAAPALSGGAEAATAAAQPSAAAPAATSTGTGLSSQAPSGLSQATPAGLSSTPATTGLAQGASQSTGMLDTIFQQGKSFLQSRTGLDVAGRVVTGVAQGMLADKTNAQKIEAENRARANAKYGAVGSRYNPAGMVTATPK